MALSLSPPARRRRTDPPGHAWAPDGLPTLAGPRLRLRWLEPDDLPALFAVFGDPDVVRHLRHPAWTSADDASICLESIQRGCASGDLLQWGVALRGDAGVIGTVALSQVDMGQGRAEVGFGLARRHWGHGYAREALVCLLDHAFGPLGLRRLEADVDPRNLPSLRILESLGFVREGYLRQRWAVGGERRDSVLMGLVAGDWAGPGPAGA